MRLPKAMASPREGGGGAEEAAGQAPPAVPLHEFRHPVDGGIVRRRLGRPP